MLGIMGTRLGRRHTVALAAVEGDIDLQGFTQKRPGQKLIKNMMRIKRAKKIADTCMVTPDN